MIEVTVDGKVIDVKDSASVIVLNIPSYSAGADLWGPDPKKEKGGPAYVQPSYSDGLVEVVGITSTFHMGRIQVRPLIDLATRAVALFCFVLPLRR